MVEPSWGAVVEVVRHAILRWLPRLFLRGYPTHVVAQNVAVQLDSVSLYGINSPGPASVFVNLRYINFNPFATRIEFIDIDVAVGHNPIADMQRRDPRDLGPSQAVPPFRYGHTGLQDPRIHFELKIEAGRAEWLRQALRSPSGSSVGVNVRLTLSGTGPTGEWRKENLDFYRGGDTVAGLR